MQPSPAAQSSAVPTPVSPVPPAGFSWRSTATRWQIGLLTFIIAGGAALRLHRLGKLQESFDAALYKMYVQALLKVGLTDYVDLVKGYIDGQSRQQGAILPPTRFLYIFSGYLWHSVFGSTPINSLRDVSCTFGIATLVLCAVFVWRVSGPLYSLGVTALMATAPVQVHMSEHALIDGFFAFWAMLVLWALWECLRTPDRLGWQILYALAGALLVMTKENSFFVFVGVAALLCLNWKFRFGTATPRLLLLTVIGPLVGVTVLICLSDGVETFVHVYRLLVAKAYTLDYAIRTGDGPWHRYLIDILTVSPLTLLLVIGAVYSLRRDDKPALYFLGFVAATYLLMCNVKYSMNLRYTTIWDLPLRYLAFAQWVLLARRLASPRFTNWVIAAGVLALCAYDLHQIKVLFYDQELLELISEGLLHGVKILKD